MSTITTPSEEAIRPPASALVFPDRVNVRLGVHISNERLLALRGYGGRFDREGEVTHEEGNLGNLYLRQNPTGTLIAGGFRTWAADQGVVPEDALFDAAAVTSTMDALGDMFGLEPGTVQAGRLTLLEGTVDLTVPRPASAYVSACADVPRMRAVRIGTGTVVFKASEREDVLYDKTLEQARQGRALGRHVLRFEHRLKCGGILRAFRHYADEAGAVRATVLGNEVFRAELAALVLARARALEFTRVVLPPRAGMTPLEAQRWAAVQGIDATGGLDAALAAVRHERTAGHITRSQAKERIRALRKLYRDPTATAVSDLAAEFGAALDAVEHATPPVTPSTN